MIDLDEQRLQMIKELLRDFEGKYEFWIYGSRVRGNARKYSDVDLLVRGTSKVDFTTMERLKDSFSESDLPQIVDIHDWHEMSEAMRSEIMKSAIRLL